MLEPVEKKSQIQNLIWDHIYECDMQLLFIE